MIRTENNCIRSNGELVSMRFPANPRLISGKEDEKPVFTSSAVVDIEQAMLEMQIKQENADYIEENY